jgi:hypothetical protein
MLMGAGEYLQTWSSGGTVFLLKWGQVGDFRLRVFLLNQGLKSKSARQTKFSEIAEDIESKLCCNFHSDATKTVLCATPQRSVFSSL